MRDEHHIAFMEVRYRNVLRFGDAALSVTAAKQRRIRRCAQGFLQIHSSGKASLVGLTLSLMMPTAMCANPYGFALPSTQQPA